MSDISVIESEVIADVTEQPVLVDVSEQNIIVDITEYGSVVVETQPESSITLDDPPATSVEVEESQQQVIFSGQETITLVTNEPEVIVVAATTQGPKGDPGPQGGIGPPGPPGIGDGSIYLHVQSVPSAEWVIVHNLGFYPAVTVIDSAETTVEGDVQYVSLNETRVRFTSPFAGKASLT